MTIRQLHAEDASAFQALRLAGLRECPEAFTSSHEEEAGIPLEVVAQRLAPVADGCVFGHFADGNLTGLIGVQREARRKLAHKAFIWGMYVSPSSRQKGVGRSLLACALEYATNTLGVEVVHLGVNTRNTAATALYRAANFDTYGTERAFSLVDGVSQDQHLMSRFTSAHQVASLAHTGVRSALHERAGSEGDGASHAAPATNPGGLRIDAHLEGG